MSIPIAFASVSATASFAGPACGAGVTDALAAASSAAVQMIETSIVGVDQH